MSTAAPTPDEIEAALYGNAPGKDADSWRLLREQVRASADHIDPDFQTRLHERLLESDLSRSNSPGTASHGPRTRRHRLAPALAALAAGGSGSRLTRRLANHPLASGTVAVLVLLIIALAIVVPFQSKHPSVVQESVPPSVVMPRAQAEARHGDLKTTPGIPQATATSGAGSAPSAGPDAAAGSAPQGSNGRLQQLGASLTLMTSPAEVQTIADGVSRLTAAEGGFVQNSQINIQHGSGSEATLQLKVPSAHLARMLAALGRLAPVRAESQSLEDITGSYSDARRALSDALAERAALLRALARLSTQGAIESLHRRLALAARTIERARRELQSISRRAATSSVEVAVLASAKAGAEGLTLRHGLHDASRVLTVALVVGLICLAGLVPLLLVLLIGIAVFRGWRRMARERALRGA